MQCKTSRDANFRLVKQNYFLKIIQCPEFEFQLYLATTNNILHRLQPKASKANVIPF